MVVFYNKKHYLLIASFSEKGCFEYLLQPMSQNCRPRTSRTEPRTGTWAACGSSRSSHARLDLLRRKKKKKTRRPFVTGDVRNEQSTWFLKNPGQIHNLWTWCFFSPFFLTKFATWWIQRVMVMGLKSFLVGKVPVNAVLGTLKHLYEIFIQLQSSDSRTSLSSFLISLDNSQFQRLRLQDRPILRR